jgi:predicted GIY-YIG superfamily endonuclease
MPFGYIYKIVFPNGKHYIGLTTTSLEQRTKEHKYCAKSGNTKWLYNALRKYNMVETFELIEIDKSDTLKELCEKEIEYILEYNSYYIN